MQGEEFTLVCMGALTDQMKEILETEFSYGEAMEWTGEEQKAETASDEEEKHMHGLSL